VLLTCIHNKRHRLSLGAMARFWAGQHAKYEFHMHIIIGMCLHIHMYLAKQSRVSDSLAW
jgi:hypothetical protein